jgi:UDP-N-acetylmuramate dehydrogenase
MNMVSTSLNYAEMKDLFGDRIMFNVPLARYTTARVGGTADALLTVRSKTELVEVVTKLWMHETPFVLLGGGSNVLISDKGIRGVVIHNRAQRIRFDLDANPPRVWAESGANLGLMARKAAQYGLSGLEWAAGIPGTLGGAIVGNAGAHGKDIAEMLLLAEILHHNCLDGFPTSKAIDSWGIETWTMDRFEFGYRRSSLKDAKCEHIVLTAVLLLEASTPQQVKERMEEFKVYRKRTQPTGASIGSMFKNPSGDFAGRLIEAAGLKGTRIGGAEISPKHANFFINHGHATAEDILKLIQLAQKEVARKFDVNLELEIELLGEW